MTADRELDALIARCLDPNIFAGSYAAAVGLLEKLREPKSGGWRFTLESVEPGQHLLCEHSAVEHLSVTLESERGLTPAGSVVYACALTLPEAVALAAAKVVKETP